MGRDVKGRGDVGGRGDAEERRKEEIYMKVDE